MEGIILTGKCKEDFLKWVFKNTYYGDMHYVCNTLHKSCLNALIIDFFDCLGMVISVDNKTNYVMLSGEYCWASYIKIPYKNRIKVSFGVDSRKRALTDAIKRANTIYNKTK